MRSVAIWLAHSSYGYAKAGLRIPKRAGPAELLRLGTAQEENDERKQQHQLESQLMAVSASLTVRVGKQ